MRNMSMRINQNNVFSCVGGEEDELQKGLSILCLLLEVGSDYTPSEERTLDNFISWYNEIDPSQPYRSKNPAFMYVNLNTGKNFLGLIRVPYEGCRGGENEWLAPQAFASRCCESDIS